MNLKTYLYPVAAAALASGIPLAPARATTIVDYELNGSLADSAGSGTVLTNNGGVLGDTGITFSANAGPTLAGLGALAAYTIDIGFTLDRLTGAGGTNFVKLIDFGGLASDPGYYSAAGFLDAYPLGLSQAPVFAANTPVRLTLSRDAAGLVTAYVDGAQVFSQADPANATHTAIDGLNPLAFFADDGATSGREATSGSVNYIRVADTATTPDQIMPVPTGAVPEPSAWGLMLAGTGTVGSALRRRRSAALATI